ncbi:MAG: hypothetical protein AAFQ43_14910, partial [Bacteroidota bacterium]
MRLSLLLTLLLLVGCTDSSDTTASEADPATDAPEASGDVAGDLSDLGTEAVESLLADGPIHVHRVTLAPGDSLPPHEGGERV